MHRVISVLIFAVLSACAHTPAAFNEGDVVIARSFSRAQYNGTPVRITGGLAWRRIQVPRNMIVPVSDVLRCYEVTAVDGEKFAAQEFQLKRPD
jgi:hypothetical protein